MADVRRRYSRDIIDVDSLYANPLIRSSTLRRQRQLQQDVRPSNRQVAGPSNSQQPILVQDSDDDARTSASSQPARRRRRTALRSPPPAPRGVTPIPPVPSVRSRHSHHRESHHRESHHRASRPRANPAIIPSNAPYPFETRMGQSSRRNRSPQPPIIPPRRPAAQGFDFGVYFGDAMIASMQASAQEELRQRRLQPPPPPPPQSTRSRLFGGFVDAITNIFGYNSNPTQTFIEEMTPAPTRIVPSRTDWTQWSAPAAPGSTSKTEEPFWKASYTHPKKVEPNFTTDFAPQEKKPKPATGSGTSGDDAIVVLDDEDERLAAESSESAPVGTLVCAKCVAPLGLGTSSTLGITEEEKKNRRVWGLRCGHMLDGRCIHAISRPPVPAAGNKRKADDALDDDVLNKRRLTSDANGKGKAVAVDGHEEASASTDPVGSNSIRSRLRSRATRVDTPSRPSQPQPRKERAKGKGRARKPVELERFEWFCPVPKCGRMHVSVRMSDADENVNGGWSTEPTMGAIGMFV